MVPTLRPDTIPVVFTVATDGLLDVQAPPLFPFVESCEVPEVRTIWEPEMVPAFGGAVTVIVTEFEKAALHTPLVTLARK